MFQDIKPTFEYENKSLEELRYEDYLARRKGPQQAQSSGLFQQPGAWASTSTGTGTGLFGSTENKSLFSAPNSGFASTGVFGSQPQQTNSPFGKPAFGAATTTATPTTNIFGSQLKPFGTAAPQTPSPFGTPTSKAPSAFASSSSPFSAFGNQQNTTQNIGLFRPKTPFSTTTTTPTFGQPSTNTTNVFNQKPAFGGGLSPGGGSSLFAPSKPNNIFGSNTMGSFGTSGFGTTGGLGSLGGGLGNPLLRISVTGGSNRTKIYARGWASECPPGRPPRVWRWGDGGWAASPPSRGPLCPACAITLGRRRRRRDRHLQRIRTEFRTVWSEDAVQRYDDHTRLWPTFDQHHKRV